MSQPKHLLTDQELSQASRVEAWRLYQEQLAADAAAKAAAAAPTDGARAPRDASKTFERSADERPLADHVTIRGVTDNEATERKFSAWEKDVRQDAARYRGVLPPQVLHDGKAAVVRLDPVDRVHRLPADTETELNGLIAECRFLMREVAFTSACLTYDPDDRIRFLGAAQNMALTAAKIGKTVAQLRTAGADLQTGEFRQRITVEHVQSTPARKRGEGGTRKIPDSANQ